MDSNKSELDELSEKTLRGMEGASRKLLEDSAANGRSLAISVNGEAKQVPARDLLSRVSKTK